MRFVLIVMVTLAAIYVGAQVVIFVLPFVLALLGVVLIFGLLKRCTEALTGSTKDPRPR
jgi:hypothetical protein